MKNNRSKVRKARLVMIILSTFLILISGACSKKGNMVKETTPTTTKQETIPAPTETEVQPAEESAVWKLYGTAASDEMNQRRVFSVMLDNHPSARPQAGLRQADIVVEMKVEGSYTRYMAVFHSQEPPLVGPIRSARECFLERMQEYDSIYIHYGGSAPALAQISSQKYEDFDGIYMDGTKALFRKNDTGKRAPHNAYGNISECKDLMGKYNYAETADFQGYSYHEKDVVPNGSVANDVTIIFGTNNSTRYEFDAATGIYGRYKDGKLDVDENDKEGLTVKNIIVQEATSYVYSNPLLKIEQIGEGKGQFISMGKIEPITWKKADIKDLTRYYLENGTELKLNPGQTWIEVVDPGSSVTAK